jgi:hypothetical protein
MSSVASAEDLNVYGLTHWDTVVREKRVHARRAKADGLRGPMD